MTIDIMMPFWGDVGLLKIAIDSVLAQTSPRWRLVVIDDRYPGDEHTRYLAAIEDERVDIVVNDRNLGVAANFQRSIDLARSSHVVIMGCDDVLLPSYVERLESLIDCYPEASYIQPGVRVIDGSGAEVLPLADRVKGWYRPPQHGTRTLSGESLALSLLRGNWTYFPSICWRAEDLHRYGFRPEYGVVLDLALQIDIATHGGTLVVDDEVVFLYRRHGASVSSVAAVDGTRFQEERTFLLQAAEACKALGWHRAARAAHRHVSSRLSAASRIPSALRNGDMAGVRELGRHSMGSASDQRRDSSR
ncbi:MAG TPA: glycosyltransferase [Pseudolysinimonas sp.]|jgi:glycosyltransferase involved in cell wall biosynthesis